MNYIETLKNNPSIVIIDGSLVDVMGTLLQGNELNKNLYAAMEEAYSRGEKIYIYSSFCDTSKLADKGVDFKKFPYVSKNSLGYEPHMVLGKIVDDDKTCMMMSNKSNYITPWQDEYSFSTDPIPEGLPNRIFKR